MMTLSTLLLLSIPATLAALKLGALALAGLWAAQGAFSAQGLLVPAASRALPRQVGVESR